MKTLKKLKLKESDILQRLKESEMKKLEGGKLSSCLACGGSNPHRACDLCYA